MGEQAMGTATATGEIGKKLSEQFALKLHGCGQKHRLCQYSAWDCGQWYCLAKKLYVYYNKGVATGFKCPTLPRRTAMPRLKKGRKK